MKSLPLKKSRLCGRSSDVLRRRRVPVAVKEARPVEEERVEEHEGSGLRSEIKQLLREATGLSQPATFAQAAKLRRSAASKEKELAQYLEHHNKEINLSYDLYGKVLLASKVVVYIILVLWFWRTPIAIIAKQLVQPFGRLLSWGTGGHLTGHVMVGIIPWLILSTRVSKYVCRFVEF
ncbi:hypothetical protein Rs2_38194 [Raphanus sativus]|nr:hypothetical protein Rs2_38194 [Raphanus sativus]